MHGEIHHNPGLVAGSVFGAKTLPGVNIEHKARSKPGALSGLTRHALGIAHPPAPAAIH